MNTDPEKNRAEYVHHLETQVQHLQRQLSELQGHSRWIPEVTTVMDPTTEKARITLAFGGKRVTVQLATVNLHETTVADMTAAVLDSFSDNLVKDQLRSIVEPEVRRIIDGARSTEGAGKW